MNTKEGSGIKSPDPFDLVPLLHRVIPGREEQHLPLASSLCLRFLAQEMSIFVDRQGSCKTGVCTVSIRSCGFQWPSKHDIINNSLCLCVHLLYRLCPILHEVLIDLYS